jgi:hypothetical protein
MFEKKENSPRKSSKDARRMIKKLKEKKKTYSNRSDIY